MHPSVWNDQRITAYVLGELSESEKVSFEEEMSSRADLKQVVDEIRAITGQLSSFFTQEPSLTLSSESRKRILDSSDDALSVRPAASAAMAEPNTTFRTWGKWLSLAASMLIVGTLALYAYRANTVTMVSMGRVATDGQAVMPESEAPASSNAESVTTELDADVKDFDLSPESRSAVPELRAAPAMRSEDTARRQLKRDEGQPEDKFQKSLSESVAPESPMPSSVASRVQDEQEQAAAGAMETMLADPTPTAGDSMPADVLEPSIESYEFAPESAPASAPMADLAARGGVGGGESGVDMPRATERAESEVLAESELPALAKEKKEPSPLDGSEVSLRQKILTPMGTGPDAAGDRFDSITENDFVRVNEHPLSTFSVDVDTASYSKIRQFLLQAGTLPPAGAVRIEEMVNYFDYQYEPPAASESHPLVARMELAVCPWNREHRLARIAIKGKTLDQSNKPAANLVFLVDTSGSMEEPNKLPLVKKGLQTLVDQLSAKDRVAIVVYAGSAGLVLDSTPASERSVILRKINQMQSGGSTNGGDGIRLAYKVARDHFIDGGINRVVLCSDGDFNVGTTSNDELIRLVETEARGGVDLTVLGFGMGNLNDSMMEQISGKGNGNYAFIDTEAETKRVLDTQVASTLVTIARDVKIQVEFNPAKFAAYRLIGYENRRLQKEDFKDDTKDAGEVGAGHSVTAFYELVPAGGDLATLAPEVDSLRYQRTAELTDAGRSDEWATVKVRYKAPRSDKSEEITFPATGSGGEFNKATGDFRFAASVAAFGMLLRSSQYIGTWTYKNVEETAFDAKGSDEHGLRSEFIDLVRRASEIRGTEQ